MPSLFHKLTSEQRSAPWPNLSLDSWAQQFSFGGIGYPLGGGGGAIQQTMPGGATEPVDANFLGYVQGGYKANGIVFACMLARMLLFSEARFQFRQIRNGRPGDLFGTQELEMLEFPWKNGTTGDLLSRMIQDADLAGNAYVARRAPRAPGGTPTLQRLRPDWMTIILGARHDVDPLAARPLVAGLDHAELLGYAYEPGGPGSGRDPVVLLPEEVAHFAPIPDPTASYRGMSWLSPVITEVMGDKAASEHKLRFFENGATPNLVVTLGDTSLTPERFGAWVDRMEATHTGIQNAYKTLYMAAGADAKVVGSDLRQIDFKQTQGAGETRIAAAAGVPPVIVGLSEGLQAATYSNYAQARRRFADMTMRPLWRNVAGSLSSIVSIPPGSELWYDDRDIPALQEDRKDASEIQSTQAGTIKSLVEAGFTQESVIAAVTAEDWSRLKHSGLLSVQLQTPGSSGTTPDSTPDTAPQAPSPTA